MSNDEPWSGETKSKEYISSQNKSHFILNLKWKNLLNEKFKLIFKSINYI
jgi:hypothetical protein